MSLSVSNSANGLCAELLSPFLGELESERARIRMGLSKRDSEEEEA